MKKKSKSPIPQPVDPYDKKDGSHDDYQAREAFDTIMRAEEHKSDPHLMKRVQKHAARKKKAIRSIQDLKDRAKQMAEDDSY